MDERYIRLEEKTLEAVGKEKEEITDTLFKILIQEHEHWLANQTDSRGTAKTKKLTGR